MYRRLLRHGILPLLLALHVWLAVGGSDQVGLVYDEPAHIVSGVYYNATDDHRFQPENGILPQRLEALPWIAAGMRPPAMDGFAWEHADVWGLGSQLMDAAGEQRATLLQRSRLITTLAGASALVLVYCWSLGVYGLTGAILTTALAALCPNLIAHAGLATTDAWGVLGALAAVLAWWRLCHRVTVARVLIAGLAAGFFAVCKFSCVLLAPVALALLVVRLLRRAPLPWSIGPLADRAHGARRLMPLVIGTVGAVALTVLVIWANYGFRYRAAPEGRGEFISTWSSMLITTPELVGLPQLGEPLEEHTVMLRAGPLQRIITLARDHRLLPEPWLYGLAFVGRNAQSRLSYFAGEYSIAGWRAYFPVALLLKSTPGGLLAILSGGLAWIGIRRRGHLAYRLAPVAVLVGVVLAAAIHSRINIGLRHILPAIVGLWMLCAVAFHMRTGRFKSVLVALLGLACVAQAISTIRVFPHSLTYFNALAGKNPDHWLVDSNLDWGQGLPGLAEWLNENPEKRPVYLSYFGTDTPARHGIEAIRFADFPFDRGELRLPAELDAGWYCFGPTQYRRVYGDTRGPWTRQRERLYRETLAAVLELSDSRRTDTVGAMHAEQIALLRRFDNLRFARLGFYLQNRAPDHRLPGGIMVFHLSQTDLHLAFHAPLNHVAEAVLLRGSTPGTDAMPSQ